MVIYPGHIFNDYCKEWKVTDSTTLGGMYVIQRRENGIREGGIREGGIREGGD